MKKITGLLLAFLAANVLSAQPVKKSIDSVMAYYAKTFDFNGTAFVSHKGKTLLNQGYGYKDKYGNRRNDAKSLFMIGSITKQFTAELILMLAKEGKLRLSDPLNKYFPDYANSEKITLEHLLKHSSGIYNYTDDTLWANHPLLSVSQERMMAIFKDKPLNFEPGEKFEYSNSNYILLSYIIEQVTGKPYTVVTRERILTPLGMKNSGFDYTHLRDRNKTVGYNSVFLDSFFVSSIEDSTQSLGAGALYSTTEDLYKWHQALQSYKLLPKEWQQKAYESGKGNYGYGWFVRPFLNKRILAHSGGIGGYYTYLLRIEEEDLCVIILSNIRHSGADNNAIAKDIVSCFYDEGFAAPAPRIAIPLPPNVMDAYTGNYILAADTSLTLSFRRDGTRFLATITGQPEDRIFPQKENLFFTKNADAQFEFVKDESRGYKLLLHQHGEIFEAMRKL